VCQKGVCRDCVAQETPRLVCRSCAEDRRVIGFEYRSAAAIGGLPFVHISAGMDPVTMRPRVAEGVIAIGDFALGLVAIAGLGGGLVTFGGASVGLLLAVGGAALGFGISVGGLAVGSVAIGGAAIGFMYALGGGAFAPAVIDGRHCDPAALDF